MSYRYDGSVMDERMESFLEMYSVEIPEFLSNIASFARNSHVPIMRRQTADLLSFYIKDRKPKRILEIGTAIGYSALFMMEMSGVDCVIDTIEKVPTRICEARHNFHLYDKKGKINLFEGDASEVLLQLIDNNQKYDFVFLDAAKAQYLVYLSSITQLIHEGGILITDNVLQERELLESRYAVCRRDRTIHTRMREYLYEISHSEQWNSIVLPMGDGVAVSTKIL